MAMFCNVFFKFVKVIDLFLLNFLRGIYCFIKEEDGKLFVKIRREDLNQNQWIIIIVNVVVLVGNLLDEYKC